MLWDEWPISGNFKREGPMTLFVNGPLEKSAPKKLFGKQKVKVEVQTEGMEIPPNSS